MFIDRVNERLKELNMKGSDLCNKLEIPTSNYTQWKTYIPRGTLIKRIADELHTSADWLLERQGANTPEIEKLISNYKEADKRGKETINNIAELEARRSRKEKTESQENRQPSAAQKIQFPNSEKNSEDELKPFA